MRCQLCRHILLLQAIRRSFSVVIERQPSLPHSGKGFGKTKDRAFVIISQDIGHCKIIGSLLDSSVSKAQGSTYGLDHYRKQGKLFYWHLFRTCASTRWFRFPFIQAIKAKMIKVLSPPMGAVLRIFELITLSNISAGSQRYNEPAPLHQHALKARETYQNLLLCLNAKF